MNSSERLQWAGFMLKQAFNLGEMPGERPKRLAEYGLGGAGLGAGAGVMAGKHLAEGPDSKLMALLQRRYPNWLPSGAGAMDALGKTPLMADTRKALGGAGSLVSKLRGAGKALGGDAVSAVLKHPRSVGGAVGALGLGGLGLLTARHINNRPENHGLIQKVYDWAQR